MGIKRLKKMSTTEIKLYDIFRKDLKLDDNKAKNFAEVVQEAIENEVKHQQTEYKSQLKRRFF
jgi:signal transduction histidine kinase